MKRTIAFLLLSTISLTLWAAEAAKWQLDTLDNEAGWVLRSDLEPQVEKQKVPIFPLIASNAIIRKTFDLTQLPQEVRKATQAASLRLFCMIADQSVAVRHIERNGLSEQWKLTVNGRSRTYGTDDSRLPTGRKWTDLTLPADCLQGDTLTVELQKLDSKTNDDFFYIGLDNRVANAFSQFSTNGGAKFTADPKDGEAMLRLVLWKSLNELQLDFTKDGMNQVKAENGAAIKDGFLHFNGTTSVATMQNSGSFNITPSGLTFSAIIRPANNPENSPKTDSNMMVACKKGSWFIGRTGNRFNFSFCTDGIRWNNALIEGEYPELDSWMHLAIVLEHVNETAQGNIGYNAYIYCNGELQAKTFFHNAAPDCSSEPIMLGQADMDEYGFQGDMAQVAVYRRSFSEAEIAKMSANCQLINHLPPGRFAVSNELAAKFAELQKLTDAPQGKWLLSALERAVSTGFPEARLETTLAAAAKTVKFDQDAVQTWNQNQDQFTMLEKDAFLLLLVKTGAKTTSPVVGIYNPLTERDFFAERGPGWKIRLGGTAIDDFSSNIIFAVSEPKKDNNDWTFHVDWERQDSFRCHSDFRFTGPRLEQTLEVENLENNRILREVTFPKFIINNLPGKNNTVIFPKFSGVIRKNLTAGGSISGNYPSAQCAMQMLAFYDDLDNGIYLACEANDGAAKSNTVTGKNNALRYEWVHRVGFPAGTAGRNNFKLAGHSAVQAYRGDWFQAGQLYKDYIAREADWFHLNLPRQDSPDWYRDNLIWLASSAEEPYSLLYLRKYFGVPFAVWWAWWEIVPKNVQPPVIQPHPRNAEILPMLLAAGIRIHPYLNGRLWGFSERPDGSYNRTREEGAIELAVQQENGKIFTENYGEPHAVLCPGYEKWQDLLVRNTQVIAEMGGNGAYYDQLPCAAPQPCFNPNHGHLLNDPVSWVNGYRKMLRKVRAKFPQLGLDGEDNAEVYCGDLDGFMTWRWTENAHVPLFQEVYGGGRIQFTARAYDAFGYGPGDYEASFAKAAEQLVNSEQIGWMHINDTRIALPWRCFIKKMAHLRLALLSYFNAGDMQQPLKFKEPLATFSCVWGNCPGPKQTSPCIQHGVWKRIKDGKIMAVFVNTTSEPQIAKPVASFPGCQSLAVCQEGDPEVRYYNLTEGGELPEVELAPYTSEVWLLSAQEERPEAEVLINDLTKINSFRDAGENIHRTPTKFENCHKHVASTEKWLRAKDASWLLFAYREECNFLGHKASSSDPDLQGNWILAKKGGIIYFGEIDFGDKAPASLEMQIAVGRPQAGGKISFYDITGDARPDRCLAEFTTEYTGGWFTFKTIKVPFLEKVTGKRRIAIRFEDKDCNFRAWKIAE